ncbi:glycosyl transferase [Streptacidiphilus pinicola]|uniref:Glycosyl transferase n=1 Tax=Streptacidiphilus pinicola TaxID=2219663 RepID=A0A2X0K522_9ACTN|nr:glycosyltransferase family 39 protein [Streptacidiphilus pinicola]RAG84365.1 glycosyl transferase [Streptacidiphilus pinicola]
MTATLPEPTVDQPAPAPERTGDPRWARPAFLCLLALTALLYLWDLGASGWANQFYSAAVQAGAHSWKAMFFGSSDSANFITVDKPPASLWVMELSARVFGVNAWSILVPQALEGVAAVAVVYAAVKRRFSAGPALVAGAVLALTPVAALMFRFNNPDALLALLLALAGYAVQRAQEQARTRWLLLAAACVGFAFLTKTLQAFLVLPAFGLTYLLFAPTGLWRRVRQLLLALVVLVVSSGWWVAVVELTPAQYRPYIGGSQHDDFLELTFGYNGFGRITGAETGSVGGGGGGATGGGMWGATGITRLFTSEMGGQIAWLLPAAFLLLVAGLWWLGPFTARRAPRTDGVRAALVLWGGALVTTFLVFSFMAGIFHPYYNVALAPYIAVVVGLGAGLVWERRGQWAASGVAAGVVAVTSVWAYVLLDRSADWLPWLRWAVLLVGLAAALVLAFGPLIGRRFWAAAAAAAVLASLAGPAAYSVETAGTAHSGSLPSAGPSVQGGGFGGGPGGGGMRGGGMRGGGMPAGGTRTGGAPGGGFAGGGSTGGGQGGFPGGGQSSQGGQGLKGFGGGTRTGGGMPGGGGGGAGGLLDGSKPGAALTALLKAGASGYTWVAAAVGSQNAAGYQLASDAPVMAVGGFNGTDPAPTLAEFESLVRAGKVHYFLGGALTMGGGGSSTGGSSDSAQIASWVAKNYTAKTVAGVTVYDLTKAKS